MNTIQYLEDQAARAERLAKRITDKLTVEKLLSFAGDRRREIEGDGRQAPAGLIIPNAMLSQHVATPYNLELLFASRVMPVTMTRRESWDLEEVLCFGCSAFPCRSSCF